MVADSNPANVLVVEDEMVLRIRAVDIVEDAGFNAIEAVSADEALSILESRSDISLLFSDIQMPGTMDGLKLAHAIRCRWPPIHLIVTSGLIVPYEGELPANGRFIKKPYNAEQVTAALRELFGHDPVSGLTGQLDDVRRKSGIANRVAQRGHA